MGGIGRAWPWLTALLIGGSAGSLFVPASGAWAHLDGLTHIVPYSFAGENTCVTVKDPVSVVF
jgi:hypothetical protein